MASESDLHDHALNSSHDFYELLGVASTANDSEIRRAYRQTALKYHPDKVGADTEKLEKFHLLQIVYDVLSDATARQVYDNARRAREEKKERERAYEGRRRNLKDELERKERAGFAGLKRKREEEQEEEAFQRELKRLAADGARRIREREEKLRQEAEAIEREANVASRVVDAQDDVDNHSGPQDIDRTIKVQFPADDPATKPLDQEAITTLFGKFGKVEFVWLKKKKLKEGGQKARREHTHAFIVYESIVGAHAAVTDFPALAAAESKHEQGLRTWSSIQKVSWASGREPECIPKPKATPKHTSPGHRTIDTPHNGPDQLPATPKAQKTGDGLRKVPSFGSFKSTPKAAGSPSMEELTLIRLKNAERRRLEEKLRQEEATKTELE